MRILVCGGRNFTDRDAVFRILDRVQDERGITTIIAGGATGADTLAAQWARLRDVALEEYPADWGQFGSRAGPIRNHQMLVEGKPDAVIAFPGTGGTANMMRQAREAGLKVWQPLRLEATAD